MGMDMHWELISRILMGAVLGGIIGYERDLHGRPAGLRTHVMVALESATFMVVSSHFVYFQHYLPGDVVNVDGSRIASSVVSGIGFLAGGAIFRTGLTVTGLTTAAGLWLVSAIGLSAGAGMYIESCASTLLGVLVLTVMRRFENQSSPLVARRLTLCLGPQAQPVAAVLHQLKELGAQVLQTEYERQEDDGPVTVHLNLQLAALDASDRLLSFTERLQGIRKVRLEPLP
jgi:putative Mg2+ transporter-C (MgtC) family protein